MKETTEYNLDQALAYARRKHPGNQDLIPAAVEELGEMAQALLQHKREGGDPFNVYKEALHLAAVAIRVAEEGDSDFPYEFKHEFYQRFCSPSHPKNVEFLER